VKAWQIEAALNALAPRETALSYDNVGLLVGDAQADVSRILLAMDITPETAAEAEAIGAQMIVSHHPVIFTPFRRITPEKYDTAAVSALIRANIAAICMHTNLDLASGGVNDALAAKLGLHDVATVEADPDGLLRVGTLAAPMTGDEFARHVMTALAAPGVKLYDARRPITRVAVCGGAGGADDEFSLALASGADAYVTSEIRHHITLAARYAGITLLDAGHFYTERPVLDALCTYLGKTCPDVELHISTQRDEGKFYSNLG